MKYPYVKYTEQRKVLDTHKEKLKDLVFYKTNKELAEIYNTSISFIANYLYDNKITRSTRGFTEKVCTICRELKDIEEFEKTKTGIRWTCRPCINKRHTEYYNENKKRFSDLSKHQYRSKSPAYSMFDNAKERAKKKGFEFNIDIEFLEKKWMSCGGFCELSGLKFEFIVTKTPSPYRPSLDRIDSLKGYTKDNVRIILFALNRAINKDGLDFYLKIAKEVIKKQGLKVS